ncbi:hypothetical protein TRAPUB_12476 [Trametes pubescens]|uniref:Uncharacterized protein n=1 Tax=Trametes pubescens TaxID=154538 RepID=A0A1M2VU17_TRAPU|nr:hypothetical protein TRAPUB_12476 [Trametes pubescens]
MADDTSELQIEEYGVWFSPSPGAYAAIRINAVEMVRHLQDDKALRAASAMQTKIHLVCLKLEMDLPFPDKPWYRFRALPIGPHLPPPNEAKGYTSDMCIPIFPNSTHPTGRAPVPSERPFPYGNCYYWIDESVVIRVRARPEGFDETNVMKISARNEVLMSLAWGEDYQRARAIRASREPPEATVNPQDIPPREDCTFQPTDLASPSLRNRDDEVGSDLGVTSGEARNVHAAELANKSLGHNSDAVSISSALSRSIRSEQGASDSVGDIIRMDIFTGPDDDLDLVPLVDLWPDIANMLKEEDIPSPLELYEDIKTIQG